MAVINKRLMAGREHMAGSQLFVRIFADRTGQVRNEIAVLKRVSVGHRNILTLVDYFETMNNCMLGTQNVECGSLLTMPQCIS
jgi:hypothetical protein